MRDKKKQVVHKTRGYVTACGLYTVSTCSRPIYFKTIVQWKHVTCKNCLKTRDSITSGKDDINPI